MHHLYGLLNLDTVEIWGGEFFVVGLPYALQDFSSTPVSIHETPATPPPPVGTLNVSRYYQMPPGDRIPQLRITGLEKHKQRRNEQETQNFWVCLLVGPPLLSLDFGPVRDQSGCWSRPHGSLFPTRTPAGLPGVMAGGPMTPAVARVRRQDGHRHPLVLEHVLPPSPA